MNVYQNKNVNKEMLQQAKIFAHSFPNFWEVATLYLDLITLFFLIQSNQYDMQT